MPHYTQAELQSLSEDIQDAGYMGRRNDIWWWGTEALRKAARKNQPLFFKVMTCSLKNVPLYITCEEEHDVEIIAQWRLKHRK